MIAVSSYKLLRRTLVGLGTFRPIVRCARMSAYEGRVIARKDDHVERSKGKGRTELKASSRGRDAEFTDRHDDSSRDEGDWLAATFGTRLLCWCGAEEASTQTQFEED